MRIIFCQNVKKMMSLMLRNLCSGESGCSSFRSDGVAVRDVVSATITFSKGDTLALKTTDAVRPTSRGTARVKVDGFEFGPTLEATYTPASDTNTHPSATGWPPILKLDEVTLNTPTCALVLPSKGAAPVRAFCATNQSTCEGAYYKPVHEQSRSVTAARVCDVVDEDMYLQRAVYFAASRDVNGHRLDNPVGNGMIVLLSRSRHVIRVAQQS